MKIKRTKTQKTLRKWKTAKVFSKIGTFALPFTPATIITIINAPEWFKEKPYSIGVGLASLVISLLITIGVALKKDQLFKDKAHYFFPLAVILVCFGVSFMFLADIGSQLGTMFVYTALGVAGGGISGQLEKTLINKKIEWNEYILKEAGLSEKENNLKRKQEIAIAKAKQEAEDIGGIL
jgi:hypothetical protein